MSTGEPALGPTAPPFPVERSIVSPEAVAAAVEDLYALGGTLRCRLLHPGANDTYLVEHAAGPVVARLYGPHRAPDEIGYELDLLLHLARAGVDVSVPITATDGRPVHPLLAPEGTRDLVLFTYAHGRPLSWRDRHESAAAGRLAGCLHAAADDFASPHPRAPLDLDEIVTRPLDAIRPFLAARPEAWREVARLASRLLARAKGIVRALDSGVCHGDFGASNVQVAGLGALTLLDFDLCGPGWRVWDLVPPWAAAQHEGDPVIWNAFLRGYRERRLLGAADIAAVPLFHALSRVWSLGMRARNAPHCGSWPLEGGYLEAQLRFLRRWEAENPERRAPRGPVNA